MQEWEYKWTQVRWVTAGKKKGKGVTLLQGIWKGSEEVEKAGQEGWELVSVQPFVSTFSGESWAGGPGSSEVSSYMFFFKRAKRGKGKASSQ